MHYAILAVGGIILVRLIGGLIFGALAYPFDAASARRYGVNLHKPGKPVTAGCPLFKNAVRPSSAAPTGLTGR